jgi:hypothetical protein
MCRVRAATTADRIIGRNGEDGLQKENGSEPFTGGCAENGIDADKFANTGLCAALRAVLRADDDAVLFAEHRAEHCAIPRAEDYAELFAEIRADRFAEKNGTDANDMLILAQMSSQQPEFEYSNKGTPS